MKYIFALLLCILYVDAKSQDTSYLDDYEELMGRSDCYSVNRAPDGIWQDTVRAVWQFKTMLGGTAIQDETFKDDDTFTSSIRQYNVDSAKWVVTYFSTNNVPFKAPEWVGSRRVGDQMVLYRDQVAPNGFKGYSRLKFYDISEEGFKWIGEWISEDGTIAFPFWKIGCTKLPDPIQP